jgi:serine-type D-Ala-D-Ala carboxypeptidase (penicillin-binding protein 5/6)
VATLYISRGRGRRRRATVLAVILVGAVGMIAAVRIAQTVLPTSAGGTADGIASPASLAWPAEGEAAIAVGAGEIRSSGETEPVPVASLAKVMTAMVLLVAHPLSDRDDGRTFVVTPYDVADTATRRAEGQSVIPVVAGEQLTEPEALDAILLPSANNIAHIVARTVAGSTAAFVDRMNSEARRLGMTATRYTDPSGYDPGTVSTARDQLILARAAMRVAPFARIVGATRATLPVAGTVTNTDSLVGRDGFVGIKTGSDTAAGGCLMFAVRFAHAGQTQLLYGVVLGQRNGPYLAAGLRAGERLAASTLAALSDGPRAADAADQPSPLVQLVSVASGVMALPGH